MSARFFWNRRRDGEPARRPAFARGPVAGPRELLRSLPHYVVNRPDLGGGIGVSQFVRGNRADDPLLGAPIQIWKRGRLDVRREGLRCLIDRPRPKPGCHSLDPALASCSSANFMQLQKQLGDGGAAERRCLSSEHPAWPRRPPSTSVWPHGHTSCPGPRSGSAKPRSALLSGTSPCRPGIFGDRGPKTSR